MENNKLPAPTATENWPQPEWLSAQEHVLLRRFRRLQPQDQAALFRLMDGLERLADLEG